MFLRWLRWEQVVKNLQAASRSVNYREFDAFAAEDLYNGASWHGLVGLGEQRLVWHAVLIPRIEHQDVEMLRAKRPSECVAPVDTLYFGVLRQNGDERPSGVNVSGTY